MSPRVLAGAAVIVGAGTTLLLWAVLTILDGAAVLLEIIAQALERTPS